KSGKFGPLSSLPEPKQASKLGPAWPKAHTPRESYSVNPARISPIMIVFEVPSEIRFSATDTFGPMTPRWQGSIQPLLLFASVPLIWLSGGLLRVVFAAGIGP